MSYDIAPLKSYVRFYLAILTQLERVWQSLVTIETAVVAELGPFAQDLGPVPLAAVKTLTDSPRVLPPELAALWRPEDEAELDGLCDVYEVVGRFSFQGAGDNNLAQIAALVANGRGAVAENDEALKALVPLTVLARETAQKLRSEEMLRAAADRSERVDKLEPMIETVLLRAKQTQDALHAVPLPELEDAASASDEYKRLRAKLQQVYQTCLPFLKNAIDKVWGFVGAPVPQTFPEELPLVPDLPPELVSINVTGAEDLEKAEKTLSSLAEEATGLKRTKEDIAARLAKLDGDITVLLTKRADIDADVETARALLDWVHTSEQIAAHRARASELETELKHRVGIAARVAEEVVRLTADVASDAEKVTERTAAVEAATALLEKENDSAPLLFGKDEWRARVAAAEAALVAEREALAQLLQVQSQRKVELSAAEVRVQTAQAEQAIVERGLADVRGRATEADKALRALSEKLGSKRPTRLVPAEEVEGIVVAFEQKQLQLDGEIERLRGEQKRMKEDGVRTIARERQIEVERQNAQTRLESQRVLRAEGIEAAYKRLATERKAAVEEHVREVLAALSKSLVQVGVVFVDPARERLMTITEPDYAAAERVAKAGEAVAPVVERLLAERGPEIASAEELLARIQKEFCEAAPAACRAAWG